MHILQVRTATSPRGLSSNPLHGPVIVTELGTGIPALRALLLLIMEGAITAAAAEGVGLGIAFTEAAGSFGLHGWMDGLILDGSYHL